MNNPSEYERIPNTPKLPKGWSASGVLKTGNTDRIVPLQCQFPEPGTYTASFARENGDLSLAPCPECEALISWSVAGQTITRRVDVISGMSVQGTAEAVTITIRDKSTTGVFDVDYRVTVTVAPGTRAPNQLQPFLKAGILNTNPATVAPAAFFDFDVPQDAGVNSVLVLVASPHPGAAAAPPIPEQAAQVIHFALGIVPTLLQYDPRSQGWVPLAPGTAAVRVLNDNALGQANQIFTVFFGIDG